MTEIKEGRLDQFSDEEVAALGDAFAHRRGTRLVDDLKNEIMLETMKRLYPDVVERVRSYG